MSDAAPADGNGMDPRAATPNDLEQLLLEGRLLDDQSRTLFAMHIPFFLALMAIGLKALTGWIWFVEQFGAMALLVVSLIGASVALEAFTLIRLAFHYPFDVYSLRMKYTSYVAPPREFLVKRMTQQFKAVSFAAGVGFALLVTFLTIGSLLAVIAKLLK